MENSQFYEVIIINRNINKVIFQHRTHAAFKGNICAPRFLVVRSLSHIHNTHEHIEIQSNQNHTIYLYVMN